MPHSFSCFTTQSAAAKKPGELVNARSVDVGELEDVVHHLGILQSFFPDLVDRVQVDALFRVNLASAQPPPNRPE